jgi:hypothetical protein
MPQNAYRTSVYLDGSIGEAGAGMALPVRAEGAGWVHAVALPTMRAFSHGENASSQRRAKTEAL